MRATNMTVLSLVVVAALTACSDVVLEDDGPGGAGGDGGSGGSSGKGGEGGEGGQSCPGPFTPSCDPGDTLLDGPGHCPSDVLCYEQMVCGITFSCIDSFPQHGCPQAAPVAGDLCNLADGAQCVYPYEDAACDVFECSPVYPEAGAPSEWVLADDMCPTWGA